MHGSVTCEHPCKVTTLIGHVHGSVTCEHPCGVTTLIGHVHVSVTQGSSGNKWLSFLDEAFRSIVERRCLGCCGVPITDPWARAFRAESDC